MKHEDWEDFLECNAVKHFKVKDVLKGVGLASAGALLYKTGYNKGYKKGLKDLIYTLDLADHKTGKNIARFWIPLSKIKHF